MRLGPYRYIISKKIYMGFLLLSALLYMGYFFIVRIYPNYISKIEIYANKLANEITVSALSDVLENRYSDFSGISLDRAGYVTSTKIDSMSMNKFKVDLIDALQKRINSLPDGNIYIPLGALTNKEFLSGIGPKIKIKVSPGGIVKADFEDEFVSCGINQVKHKTFLKLNVGMTFSSATMKKSFTVESVVPVVENIISGVVPKYYGMSSAALNDNQSGGN